MEGIRLSKNCITTFSGDVVSLELVSSFDISNCDITWKSDDESICFIRDFKTQGKPNFSDGVLLVMIKEGKTAVTASFDGKEYRCEISVNDIKKASKNDKLNHYFMDFHIHTSMNHNPEEFPFRTDSVPYTVLKQVKEEGFFDGYVISDHSDLVDNREFFRVFLSAEMVQDDDLIVFPGTESEIDDIEYDRHGYLHKNSGEIVTLNTHGYAAVKSWDEYFDLVYKNPYAICSFAHPQVLGYGINSIWNFSFPRKVCSKMIDMFRLIEVGKGNNAETGLIHERMYSLALDCGLKVSPASTSDCHGPDWGKGACSGKTIVLAPQKSKEYFIDAVRNNRVYATENGKVRLEYTVNDFGCGETLNNSNLYIFNVDISYFETPLKDERVCFLEVVSDGGNTVKKLELSLADSQKLSFELTSDSARYFYLKITSHNGDRTWSSPVWTGREFDKYPIEEPELTEIDKTSWKVIYTSGGNSEANLISGGSEAPWMADSSSAEFVIDMGSVTEISAVGIYPHAVSRENKDMTLDQMVARFVSDYEIYTGVDCSDFELASKGMVRCYGEEKIDVFPTVQCRYIKIKVLSTAGSASYKKQFMHAPVMIGEIYAYKASNK